MVLKVISVLIYMLLHGVVMAQDFEPNFLDPYPTKPTTTTTTTTSPTTTTPKPMTTTRPIITTTYRPPILPTSGPFIPTGTSTVIPESGTICFYTELRETLHKWSCGRWHVTSSEGCYHCCYLKNEPGITSCRKSLRINCG